MEHNQNRFTLDTPLSIFVSIIGTTNPAWHIAIAFSRRQALTDMIGYFNMVMGEEVLTYDACERDVFAAIADNLFEPAAIIECDL